MIYAEIKNKDERGHLDNALRASKSKNWYRRLSIITLSASGYSVKQLSEMFNLCEATIRNYIHSYNKDGLNGLKPMKPSGRSPKISNWTKERWDEILKRSPRNYEKLNTQAQNWTLELLRLYLREYLSINVSIVSVHNSLKKTGIRIEKLKSRNRFVNARRHMINSVL